MKFINITRRYYVRSETLCPTDDSLRFMMNNDKHSTTAISTLYRGINEHTKQITENENVVISTLQSLTEIFAFEVLNMRQLPPSSGSTSTVEMNI